MKKGIMLLLKSMILFIIVIGLYQNIVGQVIQQDSLALVALYDSTNGSSWTNNTNWLSSQPVSNWYGISTSVDRVTEIDLSLNNIVGTIPPAFSDLTGLTELNLERNDLSGNFPLEVLSLTNLTVLNLRNNSITGPIPDNIDTLANLTTLYLFNNPLGGNLPVAIGNLSNLLYIRLNSTQLTGPIPSEFGDLSNLTLLELAYNQLTGDIPIELYNLTNLTSLYLIGNQLTGEIPPQIGNLVNLNRLFLTGNQLSGSIPAEIGNLTMMENLQIPGNNFTGPIPTQIGNLTNLYILFLFNNQLTGPIPDEILNLTQLEDIWLFNNQFTRLPDLSSLTLVEDLQIQNNKLLFRDVELNINVATTSFTYSPQDSIGLSKDTTIDIGATFTFNVYAGGDSTHYQWKKDNVNIPGANDSIYTLNSVIFADSGTYNCEITNTIAIDLTLYSRPFHLRTIDPTGTYGNHSFIPKFLELYPNSPNPFNPQTILRFAIPTNEKVNIVIYDVLGKRVKTLINQRDIEAGYHSVIWDGTNDFNIQQASSVYFAVLKSGELVKTQKMILLR